MESTNTFEAADGLRLYEQSWMPDGEPKAVVALIHGAAEHSGRYAHLAAFLKHHGYGLAGYDLRGHGRSAGRRMFVRSFHEHVDDAMIFLSRLDHRPVFLLGHSMGGTAAALLALTRTPRINGLVLSGPLLEVGGDFSPLKVHAVKILGRILPRLPVEKLDSGSISRDAHVVAQYENDPLVYHGSIPAATAAAGVRAIGEIKRREQDLELPVLVMHGTTDRLAGVEGSKRFYRRVRSDDKTLKLYEGLYHEIFNEPEKERVMEDLLEWLQAHAP